MIYKKGSNYRRCGGKSMKCIRCGNKVTKESLVINQCDKCTFGENIHIVIDKYVKSLGYAEGHGLKPLLFSFYVFLKNNNIAIALDGSDDK